MFLAFPSDLISDQRAKLFYSKKKKIVQRFSSEVALLALAAFPSLAMLNAHRS